MKSRKLSLSLIIWHGTVDPRHYYTAPGLSFDACLKLTNVKLELFPDSKMLLL